VNSFVTPIRRLALFLLLVAVLGASDAFAKVTITRANFHGWPDCYRLSNGKVEAVVVPAIGRVMQFGFVGEEGVFWENRALDGQEADGQLTVWAAKDWVNFGGDKTWPAPEADWSLFTSRKGWRPPLAFDGWPADAQVSGGTLTLSTPKDPLLRDARVSARPPSPAETGPDHHHDLRAH
jgi:hypothetical protein